MVKKEVTDTNGLASRHLANIVGTSNLLSHRRLKREAVEDMYAVSKEKDRTLMELKEMKFLDTSIVRMMDEDAYIINLQKQEIRQEYRRDNM
ncbi:hypothetical protein Tco_1009450 [Tanacetum coccineum]